MLKSSDKKQLRSQLFRHLDGIVIAPSALALFKKGATDEILQKEKISIQELAEKFKANEGYLNVALRLLCSQGWLEQETTEDSDTIYYKTNPSSSKAFSLFNWYEDAVSVLQLSEDYHPRKFEVAPFRKLESAYGHLKEMRENLVKSGEADEIKEQILLHIEGVLVGPTLVLLGMRNMFHKYFMETRFRAEEFHQDAESFDALLGILADLNWFTVSNGNYQFTDKGLFFAKRASAYGVTVSYIPTLRKIDELIFGDANALRHHSSSETEIHVDREMNVWGSGGAHGSYFKAMDQVVIDMFNQPLDRQPKGILDMGCGNGAFLVHLYSVIENQTLRGKHLDDYPLFIIGADYNDAALKVSRQNLIQADIWAKIIWGDIGKPDVLAADLKANYGIELEDLLNVRTFLDHNRPWEYPSKTSDLKPSQSTGAYSSKGKRLSNDMVAQSTREHFLKWLPYVRKHGLLLIELHTVNPAIVAHNLGRTAATAYDATHGYSDQYILELEEFREIMAEMDLVSDEQNFKKFPNNELATVSINLFKAQSE